MNKYILLGQISGIVAIIFGGLEKCWFTVSIGLLINALCLIALAFIEFLDKKIHTPIINPIEEPKNEQDEDEL